MRTIKFRGWHVSQKKMFSAEEMAADQLTLLQFTGLHDKNGREIYEGDVVKWQHGPGHGGNEDCGTGTDAILFVNGGFRIGETIPIDWCMSEYIDDSFMEVIGNIYENSELAKGLNHDAESQKTREET